MSNQQSNLPAMAKQYVASVEGRVAEMEQNGQINLPPDYSASNALRAAYLQLQEVKDKDKRPALQVCTQASIVNSLLDMVVQGLNPAKSQCYFMVYGNQLTCQRSYHGTMAVARMVNPRIPDDGFSYAVVYEGDELTYELKRGKHVVVTHKQKLENIDKNKIKAAYCEIYDDDDRLINSALMTMDQIKQAWKQSKVHPVDDKGNIKNGTTHEKFTADMALRTVINKACKPIINSSDDRTLMQAATRADQVQAQSEAETKAALHANQGEVIDVEPEPTEPEHNPETGEVQEEQQEQQAKQSESDPATAEAGADNEPGF